MSGLTPPKFSLSEPTAEDRRKRDIYEAYVNETAYGAPIVETYLPREEPPAGMGLGQRDPYDTTVVRLQRGLDSRDRRIEQQNKTISWQRLVIAVLAGLCVVAAVL